MAIGATPCHPSRRETYTFILAIDNAVEPAKVRARHNCLAHFLPPDVKPPPEVEPGYTLDKDLAVVSVSAVLSGFTEATTMVGGNEAVTLEHTEAEADHFQLEIVQETPFHASAETFAIDIAQGVDIGVPFPHLEQVLTGSALLTVIRHSDGAASCIGKLNRFEETEAYENFAEAHPEFVGNDTNVFGAEPSRAVFGFESPCDGIVVNSDNEMRQAFRKKLTLYADHQDEGARVLQFFVSVPTSGNVSSARLMAQVSTVRSRPDDGPWGEMYLDVQEISHPSQSEVLCMLEERTDWRF